MELHVLNFMYLSIYLFIHQTTCSSIYLFIYLSNYVNLSIYLSIYQTTCVSMDNFFPFTYEKIYFLSCSSVRSYIYLIYLYNQLSMYLCVMYIINYNLGKRQTIQQSLNLRICLFCTFSFEMYMPTKKNFRKKG